VMGVRLARRIHLTIGCAFVGRFISSIDDYARKKAAAQAMAVATWPFASSYLSATTIRRHHAR
jgi:S-adenosylmethionine synthetase